MTSGSRDSERQERCGAVDCERDAAYCVNAEECATRPWEKPREHTNYSCREHLTEVVEVTTSAAGYAVVSDIS